MMLNKELIRYQDKLYYVFNKVRESHIKSDKINDLKELWGCNVVLRQNANTDNSILIFLNEIEEAVIIEETKDDSK